MWIYICEVLYKFLRSGKLQGSLDDIGKAYGKLRMIEKVNRLGVDSLRLWYYRFAYFSFLFSSSYSPFPIYYTYMQASWCVIYFFLFLAFSMPLCARRRSAKHLSCLPMKGATLVFQLKVRGWVVAMRRGAWSWESWFIEGLPKRMRFSVQERKKEIEFTGGGIERRKFGHSSREGLLRPFAVIEKRNESGCREWTKRERRNEWKYEKTLGTVLDPSTRHRIKV